MTQTVLSRNSSEPSGHPVEVAEEPGARQCGCAPAPAVRETSWRA